VVDVDFTANMEEKLDDIAKGEQRWVPIVRDFYDPFQRTLERAGKEIRHVNEAAELTDETCEKCGRPMAIKLGRFGKFLACTGYPDCKATRPLKGEEIPDEPTDEICETCGRGMVIKTGRFGKFLSCSGYPECKTTRAIPREGAATEGAAPTRRGGGAARSRKTTGAGGRATTKTRTTAKARTSAAARRRNGTAARGSAAARPANGRANGAASTSKKPAPTAAA